MNKELSPLEALEKLTNYKCSSMSEKIKCKKIIETALKDYERIKKEDDEQGFHYHCDEFCECLEVKALKIIKEKEVIISILIRSNTLDEYNHNPLFITKLLTQEEFDLLKEVLL